MIVPLTYVSFLKCVKMMNENKHNTEYLHNIITRYLVLSEQLGLFVKLLVTTYISSLVQYAGLFT